MSFPVEVPALKFYRGDDFSQSFRFTTSGVATDFSLFTDFVCQWRPYTDSAEVIDLTVVVEGSRVTVSVSAANTIGMNRAGVFDVQATDADGLTRTFIYGLTEINKDVTYV
jgi:hypothetical protein